jgi:hypothetical protein
MINSSADSSFHSKELKGYKNIKNKATGVLNKNK